MMIENNPYQIPLRRTLVGSCPKGIRGGNTACKRSTVDHSQPRLTDASLLC